MRKTALNLFLCVSISIIFSYDAIPRNNSQKELAEYISTTLFGKKVRQISKSQKDEILKVLADPTTREVIDNFAKKAGLHNMDEATKKIRHKLAMLNTDIIPKGGGKYNTISYNNLKNTNKVAYERHHMPSVKAIDKILLKDIKAGKVPEVTPNMLKRYQTIAVLLEKDHHMLTASRNATKHKMKAGISTNITPKNFQAIETQLLNEGKINEALKMNIRDLENLSEQIGFDYKHHIIQMLPDYIEFKKSIYNPWWKHVGSKKQTL